MNQNYLNSQKYSKSNFNPLSKENSKKKQIMIDDEEDTCSPSPLIFNLPRFQQDYIILEVI